MDLISILSFAAAMFVLAITPGPGVLAVTTRAVTCGYGNALILATGILLGDLFYIFLACFGLNAVAVHLHDAFVFIRYAGSAYLVWLGLHLLFSRLDAPEESASATAIRNADCVTLRGACSSLAMGFSITLGNPKVIFFYLGFLPTFMDLRQLSHADVAIVCATAFSVSMVVLATYAFLAFRSRMLMRSARARMHMNRAAGCVLTATGVVLAAEG